VWPTIAEDVRDYPVLLPPLQKQHRNWHCANRARIELCATDGAVVWYDLTYSGAALTVRPILPLNGGSGCGRASGVAASAGRTVAASADAATRDVVPNSKERRRGLESCQPPSFNGPSCHS
jgi:hypothetical protein